MVRATELLLVSVLSDDAELAVPAHLVRERLTEAFGDDTPTQDELVRRARRSASLVVIDAPLPWNRADWPPEADAAYARVAGALGRARSPVIMRRPRPEDDDAPGPATALVGALRASLLAIHDARDVAVDPAPDDALADALRSAHATVTALRRLNPPVP